VRIDREGIARLVPHQGAMCLLEEVLEWDSAGIICRAISHRDPRNPLRGDAGLPAVAGIEYAAQAVAIHRCVVEKISSPKKGYLATLRDVVCTVARLDPEAADLTVRATCVAAEGSRLLYDFRVEGEKRVLVTGRLSVVLGLA
jgi:predicted hotdog family 3-hydroxylacyl-ACP dehydratase